MLKAKSEFDFWSGKVLYFYRKQMGRLLLKVLYEIKTITLTSSTTAGLLLAFSSALSLQIFVAGIIS